MLLFTGLLCFLKYLPIKDQSKGEQNLFSFPLLLFFFYHLVHKGIDGTRRMHIKTRH